jgi:hypothetical protein
VKELEKLAFVAVVVEEEEDKTSEEDIAFLLRQKAACHEHMEQAGEDIDQLVREILAPLDEESSWDDLEVGLEAEAVAEGMIVEELVENPEEDSHATVDPFAFQIFDQTSIKKLSDEFKKWIEFTC